MEQTQLDCKTAGNEDPLSQKVILEAEKNFPEVTNKSSTIKKTVSSLMSATLFSGTNADATQIVSNFQGTIHEEFSRDKYLNYHLKKYGWTNNIFQTINWLAFEHVAKKLPINMQIKLVKFIYGWLPIGSRMTAIDPESSDLCPSCGQIETHDHLIRCQETRRTEYTDTFLEELSKTSIKNHMPATETKIIVYCLESWITTGLRSTPIITSINMRLLNSLQFDKIDATIVCPEYRLHIPIMFVRDCLY
jgi:hypothetical protein